MANNQHPISVFEIIGSSDAISTVDGQLVFERIKTAFGAEKKVVLDFSNIDLVITSFLNVCVGQLYGIFDEEFIREHISVVNMKLEDQDLLRIVTRRAKEYFLHKEKMDELFEKTLSNDPKD